EQFCDLRSTMAGPKTWRRLSWERKRRSGEGESRIWIGVGFCNSARAKSNLARPSATLREQNPVWREPPQLCGSRIQFGASPHNFVRTESRLARAPTTLREQNPIWRDLPQLCENRIQIGASSHNFAGAKSSLARA